MATRLTAAAVDKAKVGTARREIPDGGCPGLYLVVQPSGSKGWAVRYRFPAKRTGQLVKLTLGAYPALDLGAARERARASLDLVDRGIDPRRHREEEREQQAERQANTLRAVAERFRDLHLKHARPKTWSECWSALDRLVLAHIGDRPIDTIRRRDLHDVLDHLADQPGARLHAADAMAVLFRWATERELIDADPATRIKRPRLRPRERALSDDEIPIIWRAAEAAGYPFGPFVHLLLLTGARRAEIAGLRTSELDEAAATVTIPGERYKTGRTLVMPLNKPALAIIAALPRFADEPHMFTTTGGKRPISGYSKMKRRLDELVAREAEKAGVAVADWDLHDLRRTVRTGMSRLRVQPHIAEAVLGHVITGVQKHYDRYSYLDEKRAALDLWGRHVMDLIDPGSAAAGDNVVGFPR